MPTKEARQLMRMEAEDRVTHVSIDHSAFPDVAYEVCWWCGEDGPYPIATGNDYLELRAGLAHWTRGGRYPVKADTVAELLGGGLLPRPIGWTNPTLDTDHLDRMPAEKRKRWEARLRRRRRKNPRV